MTYSEFLQAKKKKDDHIKHLKRKMDGNRVGRQHFATKMTEINNISDGENKKMLQSRRM